MTRFRPRTRLIIRDSIREKVVQKHGLSADLAREFFERFQWDAILLPPEPDAEPWVPPAYVVERVFKGKLYRMVFLMEDPPGTEATLITFFDEKKVKFIPSDTKLGQRAK